MSKIEEYFQEVLQKGAIDERIGSDPFFGMVQELNSLETRLHEIPKENLDLCGLQDGKVVVLDRNHNRAAELNKEYLAARQRIEAIHKLFSKFDPIASECKKLGLNIAPTPYSLMRERIEISNQHLKIDRRRDNESTFLIRGRAAHADNVASHRKITPLTEQLSGLQARLKAVSALESKAQKIAED
jgi:hypothetical protein